MSDKQLQRVGHLVVDFDPAQVDIEPPLRTIDELPTTTAQLLPEVGVYASNTSLLAQPAGVRPRTIYRYFPDKWAVLRALAERYQALELEWMGDLSRFAEAADWVRLADQSFESYYRAACLEPDFAAQRPPAEPV